MLSNAAAPKHYVLTTPPQRERAAEDYLHRIGVQCFVPKEVIECRLRGRGAYLKPAASRIVPMLRGYVFVRLAEAWMITDILHHQSRSQRPVLTGYLASNGAPAAVPDTAMETLRMLDGRSIERGFKPRVFRPGEVVKVGVGPMADLDARITAVRGEKVKALVKWFGGLREVDIRIASLVQA